MGNSMTLDGEGLDPSVPTDPTVCRVAGYLRDVTGSVLKGWGITLRHVYNPIGLATNTLIMRERKTVRSDSDGLVQFDLIRDSYVDIELPNRLYDHVIHAHVPDSATVNLVDFLFPYLVSVAWVTDDPSDVDLYDTLELELEGTLSNGDTIEITSAAVTVVSSDETILSLVSGLTFQGNVVGTATVELTAVDTTQLDILVTPDDTEIYIFDIPDPTLPADITINVV